MVYKNVFILSVLLVVTQLSYAAERELYPCEQYKADVKKLLVAAGIKTSWFVPAGLQNYSPNDTPLEGNTRTVYEIGSSFDATKPEWAELYGFLTQIMKAVVPSAKAEAVAGYCQELLKKSTDIYCAHHTMHQAASSADVQAVSKEKLVGLMLVTGKPMHGDLYRYFKGPFIDTTLPEDIQAMVALGLCLGDVLTNISFTAYVPLVPRTARLCFECPRKFSSYGCGECPQDKRYPATASLAQEASKGEPYAGVLEAHFESSNHIYIEILKVRELRLARVSQETKAFEDAFFEYSHRSKCSLL